MQFFKYSFLLLFIFSIACKSADDYLQEGNAEARLGNFNFAIEKFKKAIDKNPGFKDAYIQEGYCFEDMNLYDSAIRSYQKLILFDQKNTLALYRIGACKDKFKKNLEAIEWYNKALASKGYNVSDSTHLQITMDHEKDGFLGETDDAKFDVKIDEIFFNRGLAFYASDQTKKAYLDFNRCLEGRYFMGSSYYMVGLCWLRAGKTDQACEAFRNGSFYGDSLSAIQLAKKNVSEYY